MIISFACTTPALLAGEKGVTRRDWTDRHAAKFYPGQIVDAWDRSPRVKGAKKVAEIKIVSMRKEPLQRLLDDPEYARREMRLEGNLWDSVEEFIGLFSEEFNPAKELYRIEFKLLTTYA